MFDELVKFFVVLLVVVEPLSLLPILAGLTEGADERHRRAMSLKAVAIATVVCLVFAVAGTALLDLLGISVDAFKVGGGILLFLLSIEMVFARPSGVRSITPICAANRSDSGSTPANPSRMVASAPGPAISGNARGNTEMSARPWASASSPGVIERTPEGRANTISIESRNSRMPPPTLKASTLMPSRSSIAVPATANTRHTTVEIATAFSDIARRCRSSAPSVSPASIGSSDSGSTTTSSTTKNLTSSSNI